MSTPPVENQKPTSSYVASEMPIGLDREIERLRAQALVTWPKEARNLQWFGLRDGMSVLEVGSGPGFVTEQLVQLLPASNITALEIDPVLIERAKAYLGDREASRRRIVEGNVMQMDFPDDTFDVVYARYLFQHLPDPVGAANEIKRVLKPGGKLVIFDVDDDYVIFDPPGSDEMKAIDAQVARKMQARQAEKGGNRLIGRRLLNVLRDAGFENRMFEGVIIHSQVDDIELIVPKFTREQGEGMVKEGFIDERQLEIMVAEVELFMASDPVIMISTFMAAGEKA